MSAFELLGAWKLRGEHLPATCVGAEPGKGGGAVECAAAVGVVVEVEVQIEVEVYGLAGVVLVVGHASYDGVAVGPIDWAHGCCCGRGKLCVHLRGNLSD